MKITVTGEDDDITLGSPEEALFYGLCCLHEVPVHVLRPGTAAVEEGGLLYCPAFWVSVPEVALELAVEVSSGTDEGTMRPLRSAWRDALRKPLVVIYREQLWDLRDASRPAQFVARLKRFVR